MNHLVTVVNVGNGYDIQKINGLVLYLKIIKIMNDVNKSDDVIRRIHSCVEQTLDDISLLPCLPSEMNERELKMLRTIETLVGTLKAIQDWTVYEGRRQTFTNDS